jgi:hypothetical protein
MLFPFAFRLSPRTRRPVPVLFLILVAPTLSLAQLDLGTGDVPQSEIDHYLGPFYRVIASGLAQGRSGPGRPGAGVEAGFQGGLVPLPDRDPFRSTTLSALPVIRLRAGGRWGGGAGAVRGMYWKDPRMGTVSTWGANLGYGHAVPAGPVPLRLDAGLGWDRMGFSSTYTYKYRGSALGLFDQDVPGDYTLEEQVFGGTLMASARWGNWAPYLEGGFDRASGRFAYLYVDPRDGKTRKVRSDLGFPAWRGALGVAWRGFRVEAAFGSYLALETGWSFFQ